MGSTTRSKSPAVLAQFAGEVSLAIEIFDLSGSRVRELIAAPQAAGVYRETWDGRDGAGTRVAPGLYLCRVGVHSGHRSDHRDPAHRSSVLTAFLLVPLLLAGATWGQASSWVVGASGEPWAEVAERWIALDDSVRLGAVQPRAVPPRAQRAARVGPRNRCCRSGQHL